MATRILLAVIAGIIVRSALAIPWWILMLVVAGALAGALFQRRCWYLALAGLAALNTAAREPSRIDLPDRAVLFECRVVREEERADGSRLVLHLDRIISGAEVIPVHIPVLFNARGSEVRLGTVLRIRGTLHQNARGRIGHVLRGEIVEEGRLIGLPGSMFGSVKRHIDETLRRHFSSTRLRLAAGLVLGGSTRVGSELQEVFTRSGVLHILSVSGLHIGFVVAFLYALLILVPVRPGIKLGVVMLALFVYAGATGFQPGVVRSSLMAGLFGTALVIERRVPGMHVLNITALAVLVFDPLLLFDISAQLSFASVYGILHLYPWLEQNLVRPLRNRTARTILGLAALSFSAQVFVTPLAAYYFSRVQTLAVFSNLLIVPLTTIMTYGLFALIAVGAWIGPLAHILAGSVGMLIDVLVLLSRAFSAVPWASLTIGCSPLILPLFYMLFAKRLRVPAIYALIVMGIASHAAALGPARVITITPAGARVELPGHQRLLVSHASRLDYALSRGTDAVDFLVAPERYLRVTNRYLPVPTGLEEMTLDIDGCRLWCTHQEYRLSYRGVVIDPEDHAPQDGEVKYLVTNGRRCCDFAGPESGTFLDDLLRDARILLLRLYLLF